VLRRAATQMTLAPAHSLRPARYALVASHEGMFGGRDYDYLRVVGPSSPVTALGAESSRTTPAVAAALLPVGAALVALLLGGLVVAAVAATVTIVLAPVDHPALAAASGARPPSSSVLGGHAFLWAVALNSFGTLFLVGGSLLSILRRQRVGTNVWIGCGA